MSTIEKLKESADRGDLAYTVPMSGIKQLLAVVEAADKLAFQYEGLLEWISDEDCECCHCDDHDKLVDVLKAYRKAKDENSAVK